MHKLQQDPPPRCPHCAEADARAAAVMTLLEEVRRASVAITAMVLAPLPAAEAPVGARVLPLRRGA
jgi:hypothetical protein